MLLFFSTALIAICAATVSPLALTLVLHGKKPIKLELPNGRHISRSVLFAQSLSSQRSRERDGAAKRSNSELTSVAAVARALMFAMLAASKFLPHPALGLLMMNSEPHWLL